MDIPVGALMARLPGQWIRSSVSTDIEIGELLFNVVTVHSLH